ncbi:MAG: mevalonate kinase [Verrucomicrobia bacterium]|nr:mevalonate kinase [Verrucomicrobiota bacterium]MBS0636887.1 mevalonate kinase [Verrucomicrobiota bacterium]
MKKKVALAPAKIILTGEHSVVYGQPAIVTAVNRFAYAEIIAGASNDISLSLNDLKQKASSTIRTLRVLRERLLESYRLCLKGQLSIREVLQKPSELFQFALISLIDTFQMEIQKGFHINLRSDIPIGCGMGSSAATLVSVIRVLSSFLGLELKQEWLHKLSMEAEKLQHGYSSGVDSYVSLHGGCVRFQQGKAQNINVQNLSLSIVNTGKPQTSTGQCVMHVAEHFKESTIWDEFGAIALELEQALCCDSLESLKDLIRHNHRLLVQLGVVPKKVQDFIQEVESTGGAAKICGAGAVAGNSSGVLLVLADIPLEPFAAKYGYSVIQAEGESVGARLVV